LALAALERLLLSSAVARYCDRWQPLRHCHYYRCQQRPSRHLLLAGAQRSHLALLLCAAAAAAAVAVEEAVTVSLSVARHSLAVTRPNGQMTMRCQQY
jgi:hypothetical protein